MEEPVTLARVYLNTVQRVNADIEELSSYASFVLLLPSSKTILVFNAKNIINVYIDLIQIFKKRTVKNRWVKSICR